MRRSPRDKRLVLFGFAAGLWCGGCAPPAAPPKDVLLLTSRVADAPGHFDVKCFEWQKGGLTATRTFRAGPTAAPPRPLALTRAGGVVVELRDANRGRASLAWLGDEFSSPATTGQTPRPRTGGPVGFETVLDAADGKLALTYPRSHASQPAMRVEAGVIQQINPPWMSLAVWDVDQRTAQPLREPDFLPLLRYGPSEWLALTSPDAPEVRTLDWRAGTSKAAAPWEKERRFAGAALSTDGQWAVLASQRVGQRWNLFDLHLWERGAGKCAPLLEGCFVATKPHSRIGPALQMLALNDRHLAFVTTVVSAWRDTLPTDGTYYTVIMDVKKRTVICRLRHPQEGLGDEAPPPYLPPEQLAALRITRLPPAMALDAEAADSGVRDNERTNNERWRKFFTFRNGRLTNAAGQTYAPAELDLYAYSSDGRALAVRRRSGPGRAEQCLVLVDQQVLGPLPATFLERLTWLPARNP